VKYEGKGQLHLPELLEWYNSGIEGSFGMEHLLSFVFSRLPEAARVELPRE
jgi:hypothetical protein